MKTLYNYDRCGWGDSRLTITPFSLEMHTCLFDLCGKLTKKAQKHSQQANTHRDLIPKMITGSTSLKNYKQYC